MTCGAELAALDGGPLPGVARRAAAALLAIASASSARADEAGPAPALPSGAALTVGVPEGTGPVAGFDRALFASLGTEAGLAVVLVALRPEVALASLDAKRIDVAAGPFPGGAAAGRRARAPVLIDGDALLKRRGDGGLKTPGDAAGKRLGQLGPPAGAARLAAEAARLRARVVVKPGLFGRDPGRELAAGHIAALIGALRDLAAARLSRPDAVEVVGPPFGPVRRLASVLRSDSPALAARLDAALGRMRADGRLAAVQRRWFGLTFEEPAPGAPPARTPEPPT